MWYILISLTITVFFPLNQYLVFPAVRQQLETDPEYKRRFYLHSATSLWLIGGVLLLLLWWLDAPLAQMGLAIPAWQALLGMLAAVLLCAAVAFARLNINAGNVDRLRESYAHVRFSLPDNRPQFKAMLFTSFSAGVVEEIIFRGYLYWHLSQFLPWWAALILANAAFALGHVWSGGKNAMGAFGIGLLLSAIYLLSGSLLPAMLAHVLVDAYAALLGYRLSRYENQDASVLGASQQTTAPEDQR